MRCSGHTTALGFPACPVTSPTPPGPFQPLAVTGPLLLVTRDGEFVTITMNWPERRNVLSLGLVRELARAFTSTAEGDSLGIVLAANGRSSAPVTTCASSPLWTCRGAVPGGAAVSHPYRPFGPGPHGRLTAMGSGKLRVYLGAAPGVGKTFAMLNEGRRRRERGTDAVVAFVETHGRARTAEAVAGLEILPRRTIAYRGTTFTEMDVDAVLARHPEVALIDELAHTNVPGSRHEKRWQDVEELLAAGIEVISTVNIQHLESLNDVVEKIDHVVERLQVLDVHRGDDLDAGGQQFLDVLPTLLVPGPGHVGVRQLVDERHLGVAGEHRVDVHLGERRPPVGDRAPREDLQPGDGLGRASPTVGLDEGHHGVRSALPPPATLVEHGEGLADSGRGTEVHAQLAATHGRQPPMRARTKRTIRVRHRSAARDRPPTGPEWRARAGRDRR